MKCKCGRTHSFTPGYKGAPCAGGCGFDMMMHNGFHKVEKDRAGKIVKVNSWCPTCYYKMKEQEQSGDT